MDLVAAQLVRRLRHASAQLAEAAVKEGWEGRDEDHD
jgi:hypothetical protein